MSRPPVRIRLLGRRDYSEVWKAMRQYTDDRENDTADQIWLVEHPPVFTLGQAGKPEHLLDPGVIPVIKSDRGGQVTYHGPGQLVAYLLIDLRRAALGVRQLVTLIELSVVDLLSEFGIQGVPDRKAPGVYVDNAKIAALGLRVRRGCSYHGLSLNVRMDLEPFGRIDPCGFPGLRVTQLADLGGPSDLLETGRLLVEHLCSRLGYNQSERIQTTEIDEQQ